MRNIIHNSITIIIVISVFIFFSKSDTSQQIDFNKKIIDFMRIEDSRDIEKVLEYYHFPIIKYWDRKNLTKNDLRKIYLKSWKNNEYSKNEVQEIKELGKSEYVVTTKYDYQRNFKNKNINSILSDIKFIFNEKGKIISVINISFRNIDKQYPSTNNLINDFAYKELTPLKNFFLIKISVIILLILNITIQGLIFFKQFRLKSKGQKKSSNINSIRYQEIKPNKYQNKNLRYEEDFNKLLKEEEEEEEEEEEKKKKPPTQYHYKNLNNESDFNNSIEKDRIKKRAEDLNKARQRYDAERQRKENEKNEKIRRQNANNQSRQQEEIRKQKEETDKKKKEAIRENNRIKKDLETKRKAEKIKKEKELKEKIESSTVNKIKRVNYSTRNIETFTFQYPTIRKPEFNSVIRSFRLGRNNRKGYKEEELYNAIKKYFSKNFEILDNAMLAIGSGTNPYEPDIAMISKGLKNIYIDIEIDEPYAGVSRKITHCYPQDTNRDGYFVDRGWFVIRFSEYQVHHQINECLYIIANLITSIDTNLGNSRLANYRHIAIENCWGKTKAENWEYTNYRETYLNHNFKPFKELKIKIDTELSVNEQVEENLVKPINHNYVKEATKYNVPPEPKVFVEKKVVKPPVKQTKRELNSSNTSIRKLIEMAISKGYTIEMDYTNYKGESSLRKISKLEFTQEFLDFGYEHKQHFKGYCHNRLEERSFKLGRIDYMKILN